VARHSPAPNTPPVNPNAGAWTQQNGNWVWVPGGTPDPSLASQWGSAALSNPVVDPSGTPGVGAWVHSGVNDRSGNPMWTWKWGAKPDPSLASQYGAGNLINPSWKPPGPSGVSIAGAPLIAGDPNPGSPTPPAVVPPTVADTWGGVAPDVTGKVPSDGGSQTVSQPPSYPAYMVSPGGIRNAENTQLGQIDQQISSYTALKGAVAQSSSQNLATDPATKEYLANTQDQLLQQIGDTLGMAGQYTGMLNYAAQNYAGADINSFFPQN